MSDALALLRKRWRDESELFDDDDLLSIRKAIASHRRASELAAPVAGGDSFDFVGNAQTLYDALVVIDTVLSLYLALRVAFIRDPSTAELAAAIKTLSENVQSMRLREALQNPNVAKEVNNVVQDVAKQKDAE